MYLWSYVLVAIHSRSEHLSPRFNQIVWKFVVNAIDIAV